MPATPTTKPTRNQARYLFPAPKKNKLIGLLLFLLLKTAFALLGLVIMIFCLEVIFSWAHIGEQEFVKLDPDLGFSHLEEKLVTFRQEGFSHGLINKSGFRDIDYPVAKSKGVVRIAILGDSKAEAFQVPLAKTFAKVLEEKLNSRQKQKYEVLNFGMSAYGTGQEYLLYCQRVAAYKPDIVVLAYHIGDSDENVHPSAQTEALPRPCFFLDKENNLWADMTAVNYALDRHHGSVSTFFDFLRRHSRIVGVLCQTKLTLSSNKTACFLATGLKIPYDLILSQVERIIPQPPTIKLRSSAILLGRVNKISTESFVKAIATATNEAQAYLYAGQAAWAVAEAILIKFNSTCQANGSRLVIAALPAPDNSILYLKEIRNIENLARKLGFQFVNIHRAFPSLKPMEKSPLYLNFHFSAKGHKLVANTLLNALIEESRPSTIAPQQQEGLITNIGIR